MIGARPLGLRRRPLWVVALLSVLSLGLYVPLWFGLSWLELRQETRDERAQPALHALSLLVPLYGYWQAYRHFSVIAGLQKGVGIARPVDALSAALGVVVWSVTFLHYSTEPIFMIMDGVELLAGTAVVVYGQRALNAYWRARPGPPVDERVVDTDWLALAAAATFFALQLVGYLSGPTN